MLSVQEIILLFTKYPEAGKSKTRLIPSLGAAGAADLQRRLTESIARKILRYSNLFRCDIEIHYDGGNAKSMKTWLGNSFFYTVQYQGDLGMRMASAISSHLGSRSAIVLIGSDCPGIDETILSEAFAALKKNEVVIGPAADGGYYLIGTQGCLEKDTVNALFRNIHWGGKDVLDNTCAIIGKLQLRCHRLKELNDIDTPEDLRYLDHHSDIE